MGRPGHKRLPLLKKPDKRDFGACLCEVYFPRAQKSQLLLLKVWRSLFHCQNGTNFTENDRFGSLSRSFAQSIRAKTVPNTEPASLRLQCVPVIFRSKTPKMHYIALL